MTIFLIASLTDSSGLKAAIARAFPQDHFVVSDTQFLVSANTTPKGIFDLLDMDNAQFGNVLIVGVSGYFGWHQKEMWDWIGLKEKQ